MSGIVFQSEDSVFFVGGITTKIGDANAGGCTKEFWDASLDLTDVMENDGSPVSDAAAWDGSQTACNVDDDGGGWVRITRAGAFANCQVGQIANVQFLSQADWTNGRYKIAEIISDDEIKLDYNQGGVATFCDVKVGGAFDRLQTASDNTDAAAATPYNVNIFTNKAETFSVAGDQIDIDAGGGNGASNTWKRIIGIDDNGLELANGSYVTIDINSQAAHGFNINDIDNIEFRHIYPKDADASHSGFSFTATGLRYGFLLKDCKSDGCQHAIQTVGYLICVITIEGGYYSATNTVLNLISRRSTIIRRAEIVSAASAVLIYLEIGGVAEIDGCVLRKTANYGGGILADILYGTIDVHNCVFYNIDDCIEPNDANVKVFQYNNIFVLHTAATGKIIKRTAGSIIYSDYSCAWAIDGVPTASNRWGGTGLPNNSIEADPQFVDAADGDFRLKPNSPCLKTGKPTLGKL